MNKLPSAKTISRFVVLTTPFIGLTLILVQQMLRYAPFGDEQEPNQTVPARRVDPASGSLGPSLATPAGFHSKADIAFIQDFTNGGNKHRNIIVRFPPETSPKDVADSMRFIAREAWGNGIPFVHVSEKHVAPIDGE